MTDRFTPEWYRKDDIFGLEYRVVDEQSEVVDECMTAAAAGELADAMNSLARKFLI